MNNFILLMLIVWGFSAVSTIFTKTNDIFSVAFWFSVIAGYGYLVLKG